MVRILAFVVLGLLMAPATHAADDGGFGSARFSSKAPNALSEDGAGTGFAAAPDFNPNDIEPAAGDETAADEAEAQQDTPQASSVPDEDPDAAERPPAE